MRRIGVGCERLGVVMYTPEGTHPNGTPATNADRGFRRSDYAF
jgi:hypothetical protein